MLSQNTHFRFNRLYLNAIFPVSFIMPWLEIVQIRVEERLLPPMSDFQEAPFEVPEKIGRAMPLLPEPMTEPLTKALDWSQIALMAYLVVVAFFMVKFLLSLARAMMLASRNGIYAQGVKVVEYGGPTASFFNVVLWNDEACQKAKDEIFAHELAHVRLGHSFDKCWVEIWVAVYWFHPMSYMLRKALHVLHEYQADQFALSNTKSGTYQYALTILSASHWQPLYQPSIIVNKFDSFTQKRLEMISKPKSGKLASMKALSALPILALVAAFLSFKSKDETKWIPSMMPTASNVAQSITSSSNTSVPELDFPMIEVMPSDSNPPASPMPSPSPSQNPTYIPVWGRVNPMVEEVDMQDIEELKTSQFYLMDLKTGKKLEVTKFGVTRVPVEADPMLVNNHGDTPSETLKNMLGNATLNDLFYIDEIKFKNEKGEEGDYQTAVKIKMVEKHKYTYRWKGITDKTKSTVADFVKNVKNSIPDISPYGSSARWVDLKAFKVSGSVSYPKGWDHFELDLNGDNDEVLSKLVPGTEVTIYRIYAKDKDGKEYTIYNKADEQEWFSIVLY